MTPDKELTAGILLQMLPDFIVLPLLEDGQLRRALGNPVRQFVQFGDLKFERDKLLTAAQHALSRPGAPVDLLDEGGRTCSLAANGEEQATVTVQADERQYKLSGYYGLHPDAGVRVSAFSAACDKAGIPLRRLAVWEARLGARQLSFDEVQSLNEVMKPTPQNVVDALVEARGQPTLPPELFVPPETLYYERLCGAGEASDLQSLADGVVAPHVSDLLAWRRLEGARRALLVGGHWKLLSGSPLMELTEHEFLQLLEWAAEHADPFSKVAAAELGLTRLKDIPAASGPIDLLVRQVTALDPADEEGPLQFLSAAFILVVGDVSRSRALAGWPPFRCRAAAIAQAGLLCQVLHTRLITKQFAEWAHSAMGQSFYIQCLVDMRLEPRWRPENISPEALKHELIGRLHAAAARHPEPLGDGLEQTFRDDSEPHSVAAHLSVPQCLQSGPLEGGIGDAPLAEGELLTILDESLERDVFEPRTLAALINIESMFRLDSERFARAVELIRRKGYRFEQSQSSGEQDAVIRGLAGVAASGRSPELAKTVRLMCRRRREDLGAAAQYHQELLMALTAAASHEEFDSWAHFVSDWALELALSLPNKAHAHVFLQTLDAVLGAEPLLWTRAGPAHAAASAFLAAEGARFAA